MPRGRGRVRFVSRLSQASGRVRASISSASRGGDSMDSGLTIRVDHSRVVVSADDGRTASFPGDASDVTIDRIRDGLGTDGRYEAFSAVALAALAEARHARPEVALAGSF